MDLSLNNTTFSSNQNITFGSQGRVKDDAGKIYLQLVPQHIDFDPKTEELGIEIVPVTNTNESDKYKWEVSSDEPIRVPVDDDFKTGKKSYYDIDLKKYKMRTVDEVGYRYVVYKKDDSKKLYEKEVKRAYTGSLGSTIKNKNESMEFTVAATNQGTYGKQGTMIHAFTDSVGAQETLLKKVSDNASNKDKAKILDGFKRTHFNKAGGGIEQLISELDDEFEPYNLILTTPIIGGGSVSSHGYHPKNHFQVTDGMGDLNDFINLQLECFERGKGYVLDGAFTSQGYEGIQFNHSLKWDTFDNWFKNSNPVKSVGILPFNLAANENQEKQKNIGIRVINPNIKADGYKYNPKRPTYVQFYDTRLVGEEQLKDYTKPIESYEVKNTEDPYEITTWQDSILLNKFEVDPEKKAFQKLPYGNLLEWRENGILDEVLNTKEDPNSRLKIVCATQQGGFAGWDGNIDLVKMNLSNHEVRNKEDAKKEEGSRQAKNYMYNVARYWTELTANALVNHIASSIQNKNEIEINDYFSRIEGLYPNIQKGTLQKIYKKLENGIDDVYETRIADDNQSDKDFLTDEILAFPLESLDFSPELLGILSTPFITCRPSVKCPADASKKEILIDNKTTGTLSSAMLEVYDSLIPKALCYILEKAQDEDNQYIISENDQYKLTKEGKYFLEVAMNDILSEIYKEALFPEKLYKGKTKEDFTPQALLLTGNTAKEEAYDLAKKIRSGVEKLEKNGKIDEIAQEIIDKYKGPNLKNYKMAEIITDLTGAGLNWRFDAAKDVSDTDDVFSGPKSSEKFMDDIIDFWTPFVKTIKKYNPSAYTVGEITCLYDLKDHDYGKYGDAGLAEAAFYEQTGVTTGSNYSTFFGAVPKFFGKNIEDGSCDDSELGNVGKYLDKVKGFLKPQGKLSSEFIKESHVFFDNHDKPMAAHLMGVDAELFWSNFKSKKGVFNEDFAKIAEKYLDRPYSDDMNSKAVAVAQEYYKHFEDGATTEFKDKISSGDLEIIKQAITHLANGYKYGETDKDACTPSYKRADNFGSTPFEISTIHVIKQAKAMGAKASMDDLYELANFVRAKMVAPYESKMISLLELASSSTGIPTVYAGGDYAQTGSEQKSKNWHLGNRGIIRKDWLDEANKDDVREFNSRLNALCKLGKEKGMGALADGMTTVIGYEGDPFKSATKEDIIQLAEKIKSINPNDVPPMCSEIPECKNLSADEIIEKMKTMDEATLKKGVSDSVFSKLDDKGKPDTGYRNHIIGNMPKKGKSEIGATYKYNDKGEGVLSFIVNSYVPDKNAISPMLTYDEAKKAKKEIFDATKVTLIDGDGNFIAPMGTEFEKMVYNPETKKYEGCGIFQVSKNGTLVPEDGADGKLYSTVNFFRKLQKSYTSQNRPVG